MSTTQRTPLYNFHLAHGARIVPFAGWDMPVQYTGIIEEHLAVRSAAGLFDVSHMGECRVKGKDAARFLDSVCTNNIANVELGQARYTILCQPDGGCVDDIIVYRVSEEEFFICLNASNAKKDIAWLQAHSAGFAVSIADECDSWAQVALQGPAAESILQPLTEVNLSSFGPFRFREGKVANIPVIISRTGYTGEPGFELYAKPEHVTELAETLLKAGAPKGLKLAGLGARDSLRLEAGYPLYGHEISETISPLQAGLGWAVKLTKPCDFIGKTALLAQKTQGMAKRVLFYKLTDRRIARPGTPVVCEGTIVGEVLSGTHAPSLGCPIGSALVTSSVYDKALGVRIRDVDYAIEKASIPMVKTTLK